MNTNTWQTNWWDCFTKKNFKTHAWTAIKNRETNSRVETKYDAKFPLYRIVFSADSKAIRYEKYEHWTILCDAPL